MTRDIEKINPYERTETEQEILNLRARVKIFEEAGKLALKRHDDQSEEYVTLCHIADLLRSAMEGRK